MTKDTKYSRHWESPSYAEVSQWQSRVFLVPKNCLLLSGFLILAACSGGGGASGDDDNNAPPVTARPVPPVDVRVTMPTAEYHTNYGLAAIGALTAYANGATGRGISVAVLDSGIDQTHPDLIANISASSGAVGSIASGLQDTAGHGTAVAGVIAATRNSTGTHGVAPSATIIALRIDDSGVSSSANMVAGLDAARFRGADVINVSYGVDRFSAATAAAIQRAVDAGIVVIMSAGNSGGDGASEVRFHARLANCGGTVQICGGFDARGMMIAVGASDSRDMFAPFSNPAGDTASAYLVAPGVGITTTALGGGLTTVSGTSFAAPHVAGAVALLLQYFPSLTGAEAVRILLSTATDLGVPGIDTTTGVGLLNLEAAFAPSGSSMIPMSERVSGRTFELAKSNMALGTAFGNALSGQKFLAEAIILDAYQRAYSMDLRDNVSAATNSVDLTSFIERSESKNVRIPLPEGLSFYFDAEQIDQDFSLDEATSFARYSELQLEPTEDVGSLRFGAYLGWQTRADVALRASPLVQHGGQIINKESNGLFIQNDWTNAPQLSMLDRGSSLSLTNSLNARTSLSIGFHESNGVDFSTSGRGRLGQARVSHKFDDGKNIGFGAGYLTEEGALFRSTSGGAFGTTKDNQSQFFSMSAAAPLGNGFRIFGAYTEAVARPNFAGASLFSNWSHIRANAFTAGFTKGSVFAERDRMGVTISQPLRVWRSSVDMTLPVGRTIEGEIIRKTQRVELAPNGRQTDIQWAYRKDLGTYSYVHSFAKLSLQPGHDQNAKREAAVGVKWGMSF